MKQIPVGHSIISELKLKLLNQRLATPSEFDETIKMIYFKAK